MFLLGNFFEFPSIFLFYKYSKLLIISRRTNRFADNLMKRTKKILKGQEIVFPSKIVSSPYCNASQVWFIRISARIPLNPSSATG